MNFRERLKQKMNERGVTAAQIARATGKSPVAAGRWVHGETIPKAETLKILASFLGTTDEWLLTGKNLVNSSSSLTSDNVCYRLDVLKPNAIEYNSSTSKYIWIDVVDVEGIPVNGSIEIKFNRMEISQPVLPDFLEKRNVEPSNIRLIKAKGDSMANYIKEDDLVGIDISKKSLIDGKIYAVYFEGECMLKQIFKEAGGKIILHSLNPNFRDKVVEEPTDLNVIGLQIWRYG